MSANKTPLEIARSMESLPGRGGVTPDGWEGVVRQLVGTLRFGVVQITVHESHVVQVERTERVRFEKPASQKPNR
jgi:hypothetical protein